MAEGGTGVSVGVGGTGVAVGGTAVAVGGTGVEVAGTSVAVGTGVGGTGVGVRVLNGSAVGSSSDEQPTTATNPTNNIAKTTLDPTTRDIPVAR